MIAAGEVSVRCGERREGVPVPSPGMKAVVVVVVVVVVALWVGRAKH